MPALGSYVENAVVNAWLRGITTTLPSTWYLALYLSNPTAADTGTEVSGTAYVRQPITFGVPSGGACANTTDISFPLAGSSWGNITHAAIRDASTSGHLLWYGGLVTPRFVAGGDVIKFLTGNVVATVS